VSLLPRHVEQATEVTMRTIIVVGAAVLLTISGISRLWAEAPTAIHRTSDQETAVKTVVTEFGKRLRMVAIMAPKEMVTKAMDEQYSTLVSADLLAHWKNNPEKAPGKRTSSPSPERIDISSIEAKGHDTYVVKGKVILLTAQERRDGGIFQANPVTMTVEQRPGKWVITAYDEQEAEEAR
jgi:hypothetical protein